MPAAGITAAPGSGSDCSRRRAHRVVAGARGRGGLAGAARGSRRAACCGSLFSFLRAAMAALRRFTSGSFGQFGAALASAEAGGGRSIFEAPPRATVQVFDAAVLHVGAADAAHDVSMIFSRRSCRRLPRRQRRARGRLYHEADAEQVLASQGPASAAHATSAPSIHLFRSCASRRSCSTISEAARRGGRQSKGSVSAGIRALLRQVPQQGIYNSAAPRQRWPRGNAE